LDVLSNFSIHNTATHPESLAWSVRKLSVLSKSLTKLRKVVDKKELLWPEINKDRKLVVFTNQRVDMLAMEAILYAMPKEKGFVIFDFDTYVKHLKVAFTAPCRGHTQ